MSWRDAVQRNRRDVAVEQLVSVRDRDGLSASLDAKLHIDMFDVMGGNIQIHKPPECG